MRFNSEICVHCSKIAVLHLWPRAYGRLTSPAESGAMISPAYGLRPRLVRAGTEPDTCG